MPQDNTVDLNQPAFPPQVDTVIPTEPSQAESGVIEPVTSGTEPVVEEQRVPYSRLRETIEARREAERRADEAEERYEQLRREREERLRRPEPTDDDGYKVWATLYGDTDQTRKAWELEKSRQDALREQFRREALEAVRYERDTESRVETENLRTLDNRLEDLSIGLGRDLTKAEEDAILTIVDEYTAKDKDGNYAGDLIPMDKAWEIYNYRQSQVVNRQRQARQVPTSLSSTQTQGEPSNKAQADKDFNPQDWNSYKKRFK